ncbi:MAG TPA: hypothetical protein VGE10_08605, partial [Zeimonas sp.]
MLIANEVLGERAPRRPRDRRTAHAHALRERTRKAERGVGPALGRSQRRVWRRGSAISGADIAGAFAGTPAAARRSESGSEGRARAMSSKEPEDRSERSEREVFHFGAPTSCIALL